jgi:two-component system, cell cycle response regulator DivK
MDTPVILCVDDNQDNRVLVRTSLERSGYEVLTAPDARSALRILNTLQVQLILLDIHMPEMTGFDFLKIVKQQAHTQAIPIIAMTANSISAERGACLKAGCVDYITKPFLRHELRALVQKALNPV